MLAVHKRVCGRSNTSLTTTRRVVANRASHKPTTPFVPTHPVTVEEHHVLLEHLLRRTTDLGTNHGLNGTRSCTLPIHVHALTTQSWRSPAAWTAAW